MSGNQNQRSLVIYGGTFDPVHIGHLRSALEVGQILDAEGVKLIPSFVPPHRDATTATAEQRLQMLKLATDGTDFLTTDSREVRRQGLSYSVDTLENLREEIGVDRPLVLVMGQDAYSRLDSWHAWQSLTDLAHVVIMQRPGYTAVQPALAVRKWAAGKIVKQAEIDRLKGQPAGLICSVLLTQLDVSATRIREIIRDGLMPDYLLPSDVIEYIKLHKLYHDA